MKLSKCLVSSIVLLLFLVVGVDALSASQAKSGSSASQAKSGFRSKSGFRGLKWGAPRSEHEYMKPSDFAKMVTMDSNEFIRYRINLYGEKPFGDVTLNDMIYSFLIVDGVEKFEGVRLIFNNYMIHTDRRTEEIREHNQRQVLGVLTKQFGNYTEVSNSAENNKEYRFENDYAIAYYIHQQSGTISGTIIITSKEMRSVYSKIYAKVEGEARKKAEDEAQREAKRQKATDF